MKKYILLAAMAAVAVPGAAVAQHHDWHHNRTEVRQDRRDVRQDRQDLRGDRQNMHQDRREVRHDRQEFRRDRHDMRQDRRYDRRNMRRSNSAYVAPYRNWNYRPVTVGYRLQPSFYGSRYYVSDYGLYHLRAPSRWQQWIRYGNDLLLVNTRTGRVLQVIHYQGW